MVSKRVVLADVPLYRNFLQKVFPAMLPGQKKAMIFDNPGPHKPDEGTFARTALCDF